MCCGCELKSTILSTTAPFNFSLSPSHHTVAMATILIDPVPSNAKCFFEPKLKQSGGHQRVTIKMGAWAEEDDGSGVCFLSLLVCQWDREFCLIKSILWLSCTRNGLRYTMPLIQSVNPISILRFYTSGHNESHLVFTRSHNWVNTTSDKQQHVRYYVCHLFAAINLGRVVRPFPNNYFTSSFYKKD